jgi:hypothetical protein
VKRTAAWLKPLLLHPPILILLALLMTVAIVGVTIVTDSPQFCASCHEMTPYYDAWAQGPHKDRWCVDCHVEPGAVGHLMHKFVALKQLQVHLTGKPSFPIPIPPEVPSERCSRCHEDLPASTNRGFPHARHAKKACAECHADKGHDVATSALKEAGILAEGAELLSAVSEPTVRVGGGAANLKGHVRVVCSICHNMADTGCAKCHTPKHKKVTDRGTDCQRCHSPGVRFVFSHSPDAGSCDSCHTPPKTHTMPKDRQIPECSSCHGKPGISWAATHVSPSADCSKCHTAPTGQHPKERPCSLCHLRIGVSFAFEHPNLNAPHQIGRVPCPQCHPKGYSSYACTCHKPSSAAQTVRP